MDSGSSVRDTKYKFKGYPVGNAFAFVCVKGTDEVQHSGNRFKVVEVVKDLEKLGQRPFCCHCSEFYCLEHWFVGAFGEECERL